MMKAWLYRFVVVVACCIGMSGCTISQWVTDARTEVLPAASATTIRPILAIDQLSQERPTLLVKLSRQLEGPLEVQERKHEQIHTIWGNRLHNIGFAWLAFPLSPIYLVLETLQGKPGEGVSAVVNTFLAATGFNAMEGSMFHISEERGADKTDRTPMGNGTRTEPWRFGVVEVKADEQAPVRFQANENGFIDIDLKKLPSQLSQRSNDLALSISSTEGTVTVVESVTVPVSTMVAWEQKEVVRAKLEEEQKAQWEQDRPAREARERAAQARAAEEKRLASIKAAAEQARVAEEERVANIKAAAEARAYKQELARKREQDTREAGAALNSLLGVFAQMEQNKADKAQAQYDNQQRQLQTQQEQQRRAQEQQNQAYMAEAARAEGFNREAARASEERARQKLSAAPPESRVGAQLNSIPREASQPSASDPRPLHIPSNQSVGPGLDFVVPKDDRSKQEEKRERERAHRENVEWYAKKNREEQAERAETNRQRDAATQQRQQELTNSRLAQEASIARETSRRIAEIQAEVNRRDAATVILEQGSCPPSAAIINNTKVTLWVTFEYTMRIVGEGSFPASISAPVAPHQRTRTFIFGAPSCDSGKQWSIPAGGVTKWQHTGRPDEP